MINPRRVSTVLDVIERAGTGQSKLNNQLFGIKNKKPANRA
jgi:hypothetical protein